MSMSAVAVAVAGALGAATSEIEPHRMSFSGATTLSYFDIAPSGLNDFLETFGSTGTFTRYTESTQGTFTVSSNVGSVAHSGSQNDIIVETSGTNVTLPQFFVSVDVPSIPTPNGTSYDNAGVGIVKDANNFLFASIDRVNSLARVQVKIGGSNTFVGSTSHSFTAPFSIGMGLNGNQVDVWLKSGGTWSRLTGSSVSAYYDFTTNGNLTGWRAGFTYASGGTGTWNFANLSCGRYGGVGIRDMTAVTNPDGSPYTSGTKVYFTATVAFPTGNSCCGVFTLDTSNNAIAQTAAIMVNRGGKAYQDTASHIMAYSNGDRRLTISTWGNGFGGSLLLLHSLYTSGSIPDILTNNASLLTVASLTVPLSTSGVGAYDPFLVYDGSLYWLAYSITNNTNFTGNPFYAALATSSNLTSWTLVGADSANNGWEGTKILKANKKYWVLAGGPAGSGNSSRIYDATMTYVGALPGASFSGGSDTQPHPMVFADPDGKHQTLLSFNNTRYTTGTTFTWGQPTVQKSPRFW